MNRSINGIVAAFVMRVLSAFVVLLVAFFVSATLGFGSAYAADAQNPQATGDNGDALNNVEPIDEGAGSAVLDEAGASQADANNQGDEQVKASTGEGETLLGQSGGEALSTTAANQDVVIDLAPLPDTMPDRVIGSDAIVTVECNAGEGVYLSAFVDYMSVGDQVVDARINGGELTLPAGTAEENILISWYYEQAPFEAGTYYSDPAEYQAAVSGAGGSGAQFDMTGDSYVDINAQDFLSSYAYTSYVRNRFAWQEGFPGSSSSSAFVPIHATIYPFQQPWALFFDQVGQYRVAAQATYVIEKSEERTDDNGEPYLFVSYVLHASNEVQFVINVNSSPSAQLKVSAKDQDGNIVDINTSQNDSDFEVKLRKYFQYTETAPDSDIDYVEITPRHFDTLASDDETFRYNYATAGFYKLDIVSKYGNYEQYSNFFQLTPEQIATGVIEMPVVLTAVAAPVTYKVVFFDEDGTTVLLTAKEYNENTLGSVVEKPQNMPEKAEDDDYSYVFDYWLVSPGDKHVSWGSALDVTSDMTYTAVYRGISKQDDPGMRVVYATGGLFGKPKPDSVARYELAVSEVDAAVSEGILGDYATYIGNNSVAAVYEVDLTQYNKDGSTENLTENLGDMVLSFVVPNVADGAKAKVIQLHMVPGAVSPTVILHPDLVVSDGIVNVPLDGRLSIFIVTLETASDDFGDGSGNEGGSQPGNEDGSQSGEEPASQDGTDSGDASGEDASSNVDENSSNASKGASSDEVVVSSMNIPVQGGAMVKSTPVKATSSPSSTSDAGTELPKTGDPINASMLLFAALASALIGLVALNRRKCRVER